MPYRDVPSIPPGACPPSCCRAPERRREGVPRSLRVADGRVRGGARHPHCGRAPRPPRDTEPDRRRARRDGRLPLLLGSVVLTRFDLWPAALVAGALAALVHDRHRLGLGLLGAAIAVKLARPCSSARRRVRLASRGRPGEALVGVGVLAGVLALAALPSSPLRTGRSRGQHRAPALPAAPDRRPRRSSSPLTTWSGSTSRCAPGTVPRTCTPRGRRSPRLLTVLQLAPSPGPWLRRPGEPEARPLSATALVAVVALGKVLTAESFSSGSCRPVPLVAGRRGQGVAPPSAPRSS